MDIKNLNDLVLWNPPPVKFYIGSGILAEGSKAILFGNPKLGKSVLVQQLGFSLVTAMNWITFKTQPASVMYLQAEIAPALFRGRMMKMWQNFRGPHIGQYLTDTVIPPPKMDMESGMKQLDAVLYRHKPQVLILDPLYRFISGMNMESMQRFVDNLDRLIYAHALTIVVVSHPRKTQMDNAGATINMGSEELWGPRIMEWYFDTIIYMQGDVEGVDREITFMLRNSDTLWVKRSVKLDKTKLLFT